MAKVDLGKIGGFVAHYASELLVIAGTLQSIVDHLPIDAQDRERITDSLNGLQKAANAAAKGAAAVATEAAVKVRKSDVEAAVAAYIASHPELIDAALAKVGAAAETASENGGENGAA